MRVSSTQNFNDLISRIGNTRLIKINSISQITKANIYAKLEFENPTGTHKDRESLALCLDCRDKGFQEIGCASTGNFAISLAYISQVFGLKAHIWVNKNISKIRENYLKAFDANLHFLKGNLHELYVSSSKEMKKMNIYDANPGGNNIKINANSLITKEIKNEIKNINSIITCVNNGTHVLGVSRGNLSSDCFIKGIYTFQEQAKSISGFCCFEGIDTLNNELKKYNGILIEAFKNDIREGADLALKAGLIIEASSAITLGFALRSVKEGENICCILTGNGLKFPNEIGLEN